MCVMVLFQALAWEIMPRNYYKGALIDSEIFTRMLVFFNNNITNSKEAIFCIKYSNVKL